VIVLLVLVLAVGVWTVMLAVGGADPQEAWERRLKRRYRGYHRAPRPPARPLVRVVSRHLRH
jgi:hypothetical protein